MKVNWHEYEPGAFVAFPHPCQQVYGNSIDVIRCTHPYQGHGHVLFRTDEDGWCFISFPVESREGLDYVLRELGMRGLDYRMAGKFLLALPDVSHLPTDMSATEAHIIADAALFRAELDHIYRSP